MAGLAGYSLFVAVHILMFSIYPPVGGSPGLRIPLWILAFLAVAGLAWSVLLEIPLRHRPSSPEDRSVYDRGTYALVRHPGFLWYTLAHLALMPLYTDPAARIVALILIAGDFSLVLWEDLRAFPRMFTDWDAYRARVPFLWPGPYGKRRIRHG